MRQYPVFLDLHGRVALLLGTGEAIERRAATLAGCGAVLRHADRFADAVLDGVSLAIGSGAPEAELRALFEAARARGIPVNVIDRPELSTYLTPAVVDREPLAIAIGTGGAAPVLARLIRARIETLIAPAWGRLAVYADRMKAETRRRIPDTEARRRMLEATLGGRMGEMFLAGAEAEAENLYRAALEDEAAPGGIVHLVGAGPGAADLLSLRGLRLLGEAEVIVHDRLGTEAVLELARRDARRIDVGKTQGAHTMPQREINALLIRLAREGRRVVRLKGGDPFVFGRGGEEVEALRDAGVAFTVVPGITAALACAASAAVPLTHRDAAHAVTFVTAHRRREDLGIDYAALLRPGVTLAIYMGLATIDRLCAELAAAGFSCDIPAVLIENGGTPQARVLAGPIGTLAERARDWVDSGPVLILLGGSASRAVQARSASGADASVSGIRR